MTQPINRAELEQKIDDMLDDLKDQARDAGAEDKSFIPTYDTNDIMQAIDAYVNGIIGEGSHIHDGAAGDEATWEGAQNSLRTGMRKKAGLE